jgi:O-antigen/teichoic acid export membrane protein
MVTFGLVSTVPYVLELVVAQRSEVVFLARYSGDAQIALYAVAFALVAALLAIPAAVQQVLSPTISTLFGAGAFDRIRGAYGRAIRLLLLVSVPLAGGTLALGPAAIVVAFGQKYQGAGNVLLVLASSLPLVPVSGASAALLVGYRRMRFPLVIGLVAAAIDVGAAAVLVPHLDAIGAALANTAAQLVSAAIALVYCARLVGGIDLRLPFLWRMVGVTAVASGASRLVLVFVDGPLGFALALVVAVVLFTLLAAVVGVLPGEDAQWLADSSAGSRGRLLGRVSFLLAGQGRARG